MTNQSLFLTFKHYIFLILAKAALKRIPLWYALCYSLPAGQETVGEDVIAVQTLDSAKNLEGDSDDECSSDFVKNGKEETVGENVIVVKTLDSAKNLEEDSAGECSSDFVENGSDDEENGNDFIGSLTKISPEENEDIFKSSDVEKTECIQLYTMEGFKSPVEVCIKNQGPFTCPSVGGKVLKGNKWIPAENVTVEVSILYY